MPLQLNVMVAILKERIGARLSEWHLASAMTVAGALLLQPGTTFSLEAYAFLRLTWSEDTWGFLLFSVGTVRVLVLAINGTLPRGSPHLRALLALVSAAVWAIMLTGYLLAPVLPLMAAFTGTALVVEWFNVFRAASSARVEDERCRGRKNGLSS